jgi:hypothetical protein
MKTAFLLGTVALAATIASTASAEERTKTRVLRDRDGNAVSTTRTTSFTTDEHKDVMVNSRADERRIYDDEHWTLAPMLGWGSNGLGLSVGARAGYTFDVPLYLGGNFMYHVGDSGGAHAYYPSAEVGYDIGIKDVVLRPYGGVGALFTSAPNSATTSTGVVYPGLTAHYLVPRSPVFLGGDARLLVPFEGSASVALTGTTGLNF